MTLLKLLVLSSIATSAFAIDNRTYCVAALSPVGPPVAVVPASAPAPQNQPLPEGAALLKNGSVELLPIVNVTMMALRQLIKRDPIAFYELVMVARDRNHRIFAPERNIPILEATTLFRNGRIAHDSFRNVILSAATGEGADMALDSPLAAAASRAAAPAPAPLPSIAQSTPYFASVEQIIDFILGTMASTPGIKVNRRIDGVNPFYGQIEANGGIGLVMSYGMPLKIITPLGEIMFRGGCSRTGGFGDLGNFMPLLTERLGLEVLEQETNNDLGSFGPVYSIRKDLAGDALPAAIRRSAASRIPYEAARDLYERVAPPRLQPGSPEVRAFPPGTSERFGVRGIGLDSGFTDFVDGSGSPTDLLPNIAAFVDSEESGKRIVQMFGYGRARLDARPGRLQVKMGAKEAHAENLELLSLLVYENGSRITPEIIDRARRLDLGQTAAHVSNLVIDTENRVVGLGTYGIGHGSALPAITMRVQAASRADAEFVYGIVGQRGARIEESDGQFTVILGATDPEGRPDSGSSYENLRRLRRLIQENGGVITRDIVRNSVQYTGSRDYTHEPL